MIGYVTLGTNNLVRAAAFYDALLAEMGAKRLWEFERGIAWGCAEDQPCLAIMKPFDGKFATAGNGAMVALGGADEGPAGLRGNGFYAGYFRDLDGNKLNVFYYG